MDLAICCGNNTKYTHDMSDYNILNVATFDDIQKQFIVSVQPFLHEGQGQMDLGGPNNVFWVRQIEWASNYIDVGVPNARESVLKPLIVSVADILQEVKRALPPFIEPRPLIGSISFKIINTNISNNHKLEVEFRLRGVLVSPRPGCEPLPLKVMKAYVMMDSTSRGKLAMQEAAVDRLEETLADLGMGSLRESLPGGLSALKDLPLPLQQAVIQGLISKGELPESMSPVPSLPSGNQRLALTDMEVDSDREESTFIGDFLETSSEEASISVEHLKRVAKCMIDKGWRRV